MTCRINEIGPNIPTCIFYFYFLAADDFWELLVTWYPSEHYHSRQTMLKYQVVSHVLMELEMGMGRQTLQHGMRFSGYLPHIHHRLEFLKYLSHQTLDSCHCIVEIQKLPGMNGAYESRNDCLVCVCVCVCVCVGVCVCVCVCMCSMSVRTYLPTYLVFR